VLTAAIREHREDQTLVAALTPVSGALRPLEQMIERVLVQTDLEPVMTEVDAAYERGELTQTEAEDLARLAVEKSRQIPGQIEDLSLDAFAQSGQVRRVASKVLNETVLFVADNVGVPKDNALVVYQASELKALTGMPSDQLRKVHATKKMFDGEIL
jgi:hypothetical protein